jgi:hypothetical protein
MEFIGKAAVFAGLLVLVALVAKILNRRVNHPDESGE